MFQSSPAPKGRCNHLAATVAAVRAYSGVSILTGPEGPVQHVLDNYRWPPRKQQVSILTGPEGPVQLPHRNTRSATYQAVCFNPHRPRRAGATQARRLSRLRQRKPWFQSSPAPKGRCNPFCSAVSSAAPCVSVSILTGPEGPVQRVAVKVAPVRVSFDCFNPHRPRRAGANYVVGAGVRVNRDVSILTGPEGPVQLFWPHIGKLVKAVMSFNPHRPRRAGATYWRLVTQSCMERSCFNPHRPRRAGATPRVRRRCSSTAGIRESFNPHRPRRAGATPPSRWRFLCPGWHSVSILTGPEGPVQL